MTHLFDQEAAIQLALAGEASSGWRVLRPDISYWKALHVAFSDTFSDIYVVIGRVLAFILWVALFLLLRSIFNISDEYMSLILLPLFFSFADILAHPITYILKDRRAKLSLLVLTPEGFLQHHDTRKPTFKGTAYAYTEIASIKIIHRSNSGTTLRFTPYHGKATRWECPYWYGPAQQTAQDIIDAHAQYQALNNHSDASREK